MRLILDLDCQSVMSVSAYCILHMTFIFGNKVSEILIKSNAIAVC